MTTLHRMMRALRLALALAASGACGREAGPAAVPAEVRATSGDGQMAPIETMLPAPLVATVVDDRGDPLPGVMVGWTTRGIGRIEPDSVRTDFQGRALARWVLPHEAGTANALAGVLSLPPATFHAVAQPIDALPPNEIRVLSLRTYEGSGQVVHPDYARTTAGNFGHGHHLAITPYPYGNAAYENPSMYASLGRPDDWLVEPGVTNPVARPESGHLSDPDLVFDPETNELRLYYRQATRDNVIWLIRSTDGATWSVPVEVLRRPNHQIVSPAVVRKGPSEWYLWAVNSGPVGCGASSTVVELRRSSDGVRWSEPEPLEFPLPDLWPWHIEVQWIEARAEFWAVFNAKTRSGCTTPAVFISRSADGVRWTVGGEPVIAKGRVEVFQDIVYRSTFDYEPESDMITFWYSGARHTAAGYVWGAAVERRRRDEVFAPRKAALEARLYREPPAPLVDWP